MISIAVHILDGVECLVQGVDIDESKLFVDVEGNGTLSKYVRERTGNEQTYAW